MIPQESQEGSFYRAILAIHKNQYEVAQNFIDKTRDLLDTELTAMAGESYQRAYGAMVQVQILAELEEVMQYRLVPERRPTIKGMWWVRLLSGQRVPEDWQKILLVSNRFEIVADLTLIHLAIDGVAHEAVQGRSR